VCVQEVLWLLRNSTKGDGHGHGRRREVRLFESRRWPLKS
jgi:hypothetical protein